MSTQWDDRFEQVLRRNLPDLPAEDALLPEADLMDLGLDSMGMISLLMDLETEYGVRIPESELTFEAFASVAGLWAVVGSVTSAA
ncbi:acyl carrier protein [Streptomyces mobaraensis NBRC 13819 = DSM 40847]|uniref:Acyl carrier protein n=2 Tax=Streptomyces mobaraensis TaxID=35621 RepID=A0A5N5VZF0_STRMB|nr:phosphopantetheine-binding protein [Streptomyces mobaraensis]EMF01999.1 acyl-carrier-protein [Streptomyces mobaraensis NBRC 13819 = DSM 40847]KAB7834287.1 acyl carrier protein [Streptomyces mobaraensis]QTT76368.1 acyl carrier protein [Streptomyces mobaraensis NBRC 13819 = DSM 40847]